MTTPVNMSTTDLESLNALAQTVIELRKKLAHLEASYAQLPSSPASEVISLPIPPQSQPRREPRMSDPEPFDGRRSQVKNFLSHIRLVIHAQPSRFPDDRAKVVYTGSFLRGTAYSWFQPIVDREDGHPLLDDFPKFSKNLEAIFGDPDEVATSDRQLRSLFHTSSAATYSSEFRRLSSLLAWNDVALCSQYYHGLKDVIKDELAKVDRPESLEDLINLTIRLDNRLHERRMQKTKTPVSFPRPSYPAAPVSSHTDMEIDGTSQPRFKKLTDAEKKRRRDNNLCMYCGGPGHIAANCTAKSKSFARPNSLSATVSQAPKKYSSEEHIILPVRIVVDGVVRSTFALLDSGATNSFIDMAFASSVCIPLRSKAVPRALSVIDGRPIASGAITHETLPFQLDIGSHSESLVLDVTSLGQYPIILGISWLKKHDPFVMWSKHEMSFPCCPSSCESDPAEIIKALPEFPDSLALDVDFMLATVDATKDPPLSASMEELPKEYHDFLDVFSKDKANKLPPRRPYDHVIPLQDKTIPPFGPIYSLSEKELSVLSEYIKENLAKGFIRPSTSPAGSPILFVKKKDGSLRLCVDYRGLNKITIKNRYPLPLIHELLDRLQGSVIFTRIDLRGAYNLVRVAENEEWKTAFRTRYGHFEYMVMPFGLTNAPATFQCLMNDIFRDCLDIYVIAYLDDILVFSKTKDEHVTHVKSVLQRLRNHSLFAKAEKCEFHQTSVKFLGYEISGNGVQMDSDKVQSVMTWPPPKNVDDVMSFLGFANFYRRFIGNYSHISAPLTNLLKKGVPFSFGADELSAFKTLKTTFSAAPILKHFDPLLPIVVETDASDYALGAVLSQKHGSLLHPVSFYSRKMSSAELNYMVYDKEMLAIVSAIKEWRAYLEGSHTPFSIVTDHKNIEPFMEARTLNRRQARWAEILSGFDFVIQFRPGSANVKADALSRRPDYRPSEEEMAQCTPMTLIRPCQIAYVTSKNSPLTEAIMQAYDQDLFAKEHLPFLCNPSLSRPSDVLSRLEKYSLSDGLILMDGKTYVPDCDSLRAQVMDCCHNSKLAGHFGHRKSLDLVSRSFWWPRQRAFVKRYVSTCDQCKRCKPSRHKPYGELRSLPVPSQPWTSIGMDFIVKLPVSHGFDSIFVVIDRFTKMAYFIPCKETVDAKGVASLFIDNILRCHGLPSDITSDRGSVFLSKFWTRMMTLLEVNLNHSSSFHPQTNGQTERVNGVLEQYLRLYCNHQQDNWKELLPLAQFAYNNAIHSATGKSPFFANFGYHPKFSPQVTSVEHVPAAESFVCDLKKMHEDLATTLRESQLENEKYYNRTTLKPPTFEVGTKVWLSRRFMKTSRPSDKLDHRFLGPFQVIAKINPVCYRLELPASMKIHNVFHVSLLEKHQPDPFVDRQQEPPKIVTINNQPEYEVDTILDSKIHRNSLQYFVSWKGYSVSDRTWEPVEHLKNCIALIHKFHLDYPSKPNKSIPRPTPRQRRP